MRPTTFEPGVSMLEK